MNPLTPPAGWWPLIGLLVVAAVVVLAVEVWPEPRTPEQKDVDRLVRKVKAREKTMRKRGWDR